MDTSSTITSTTGDVTFSAPVDEGGAAGTHTLTAVADSGTVTFSGGAGSTTQLGGLTVTADTLVLAAGNFYTDSAGGGTANVDFSNVDTVTLTGDVTIDTENGDDSAAGDVLFKPTGTINGTTASTEYLALGI